MNKTKKNSITGQLSEAVAKEIIENNRLSLQIALVLEKTQVAIKDAARRRSDKLLHMSLLPLYESYGYSKEDLEKK